MEEENQTINILKKYIHEHLDEKLSREQLSSIVYLSPGYVTRLFKQENGVSLFDYIVTCRVERAGELLRQKDIPVGDIASMVGYDNFSYFSELFKAAIIITQRLPEGALPDGPSILVRLTAIGADSDNFIRVFGVFGQDNCLNTSFLW